MQRDSFSEQYSAKADEELLALAADRKLLEPMAKVELFNELARRNLQLPHGKGPPSATDQDAIDLKKNPAFNTPAKIASVVYTLCLAGFVIAGSIGIAREDIRLIVYIGGSAILIFGLVFGAIIWATRRHFQRAGSEAQK